MAGAEEHADASEVAMVDANANVPATAKQSGTSSLTTMEQGTAAYDNPSRAEGPQSRSHEVHNGPTAETNTEPVVRWRLGHRIFRIKLSRRYSGGDPPAEEESSR